MSGRSRTRRRAAYAGLLVLCGILPASAAQARLSALDLRRVSTPSGEEARAPLDLRVVATPDGREVTLREVFGGRPTVLLLLDYACRNVCDPMASMLIDAAERSGLPPDSFRVVFVGIDPRDDVATARRQVARLGGEASAVRQRALVASRAALDTLTSALHYTAIYDPGTETFAHPATALLVAPDGQVVRTLSPLALTGGDLRLALTDVGGVRVGGIADQVALICYGYDAVRGIYTPSIRRVLLGSGAITVLALAAFLLVLVRAARRRRLVSGA